MGESEGRVLLRKTGWGFLSLPTDRRRLAKAEAEALALEGLSMMTDLNISRAERADDPTESSRRDLEAVGKRVSEILESRRAQSDILRGVRRLQEQADDLAALQGFADQVSGWEVWLDRQSKTGQALLSNQTRLEALMLNYQATLGADERHLWFDVPSELQAAALSQDIAEVGETETSGPVNIERLAKARERRRSSVT